MSYGFSIKFLILIDDYQSGEPFSNICIDFIFIVWLYYSFVYWTFHKLKQVRIKTE